MIIFTIQQIANNSIGFAYTGIILKSVNDIARNEASQHSLQTKG